MSTKYTAQLAKAQDMIRRKGRALVVQGNRPTTLSMVKETLLPGMTAVARPSGVEVPARALKMEGRHVTRTRGFLIEAKSLPWVLGPEDVLVDNGEVWALLWWEPLQPDGTPLLYNTVWGR